MLSPCPRPSHVFVSAVAFLLALASALPAGASSRDAAFCRDLGTIGVVPTPALPSNDSPSAIASAVTKLPSEIATLRRLHAKLAAAAASSPVATLGSVLRDAATSVTKETSALSDVISEEAAVLSDPENSSNVLALAHDLIAAVSAAASANAYINVERPTIAAVCKGSS